MPAGRRRHGIERLLEVQKLSDEEKWMLVDELWTDLTGETLPLVDPAIVEELERRTAHYKAHPETATTWEAIRDRLRAGK